MIVSFHPLFEADKNIICAGRKPNLNDLAAISAAKAVVLPQGCSQVLYEMAIKNCNYVFPNYETRFKYPGKIGQIQLFRKTETPHPHTQIYPTLGTFQEGYGKGSEEVNLKLPFVFKFDWGGEGETVYLINTLDTFRNILQKAVDFEHSGQKGFLIQEVIPTSGGALRVVIIGKRLTSYWRIQQKADAFAANISKGAQIDFSSKPALQEIAKNFIGEFCGKTGINLAGFDVIFSPNRKSPKPLLLEINYFFGRKGLGGSEAYYEILNQEINHWLSKTVSGQD
jgi:ribosomal protein S6--L-glutamate ligase